MHAMPNELRFHRKPDILSDNAQIFISVNTIPCFEKACTMPRTTACLGSIQRLTVGLYMYCFSCDLHED